MLSNSYRQSSRFDEAGGAADSENKFLWHGPARRLEAEVVRDAILSISGALDTAMGGPGFHSFNGKGSNRRSVYYINTLSAKNSFLETLIAPTRR